MRQGGGSWCPFAETSADLWSTEPGTSEFAKQSALSTSLLAPLNATSRIRWVKRNADEDQQSMNAWIESLLTVEDMRRRCAAHDEWTSKHPEPVALAEAWADLNLEELARA